MHTHRERERVGPSHRGPGSDRLEALTRPAEIAVDGGPVPGLVQPGTLVVGSVSDAAELDADATAHRALGILRRRGGRTAESTGGPAAGGPPRPDPGGAIGPAGGPLPPVAAAALARLGAGLPLPAAHRGPMEQAFGADFGAVRVHTGDGVGSVARSMQARAFTLGRDVYLPDGLPDVGTDQGRHLLAHELAHTLQGDPGRIGRFVDTGTLTAPQRHALVHAYRTDNLASAMWGRESDLAPIATGLGIRINVVDYSTSGGADSDTDQMKSYGQGAPIYLRYSGDHYNILVPAARGRFSYTPAQGQALRFRSNPVPGNGDCLYVSIWRAARTAVGQLAALVNPQAPPPNSDAAGQQFLRDLAHGANPAVTDADVLNEIAALTLPLSDEHVGPALTAALQPHVLAQAQAPSAKSGKDRQPRRVRFAEDALASEIDGSASGPVSKQVLSPGEVKKRLAGFKNAPQYWADLDWVSIDANLMKAEIRAGHPEFDRIAEAVAVGLKDSPYTSPAGESTRMEVIRKARDDLAAKPARTKEENDRLAIMDRRLREGTRKGPAAPRSRPVVIDRIEVIANQALWSAYQAAVQNIRGELKATGTVKPLRKVAFGGHRSQVHDAKGQDPAGEVNLFHGTSPFVMDILEKSGFDPSFSANKAKPGAKKARYGPLGQGVYFADVMSKAMTYARCPVCSDYDCQVHKDETYEMLYSRVALGRTKKAHAMLQRGDLRADDLSTLKDDRHSVYSKGVAQANYNLFDAASGQNEYVVKEAAQTYPEFRIYYQVQNPKKPH
ncbi:DUF4157 domain-containing protein [Nakamurella sp.]|uniref:eCIS core domain-containing protein n=1 Tax=Nakamurella sp. TaxID=1869182 RepID=UPI0037849720